MCKHVLTSMQKEKNKFSVVLVKTPGLLCFFFFNSLIILATCTLGVSGLENCMSLKFCSSLSIWYSFAQSLSSFAPEILMP